MVDKVTAELKRSLAGIIEEMSDILKNAPEKIDKLAFLVGEFQRQSAKAAFGGKIYSEEDKLAFKDKKLQSDDVTVLDRVAKTIEKRIVPYIEANNQFKTDLKTAQRQNIDAAIKDLDDAKDVLKSSFRPR